MQVPGLQDPTQLKAILGKTAKMTFQLVDEQANPLAAIAPIGDEILPQQSDPNGPKLPPIVVQRRVAVSGDRLTDASQTFDSAERPAGGLLPLRQRRRQGVRRYHHSQFRSSLRHRAGQAGDLRAGDP